MNRWRDIVSRTRPYLPSVTPNWKSIGIELTLLAVLLIATIVPRVVLLGTIPPGLNGDEASFGLAGRRILQEGSIGVFSTDAATGTPAGTFYWTAAVFWVFGQSVFTLRLAYALLGIATIPIAYLAFRVMFNRTTGFIAAMLLAFMAWHLHFSRIAHVAIAWPLVEVATLFALFLGLKHRSRPLFALAGLLLGSGIYTYAAYTTFAIAVGVFLVWLGVVHYRSSLPTFVGWVGVLLGAALFAGLPMASYYHEHPAMYSNRLKEYSVTRIPEYHQAHSVVERGRVIAERELDFVQLLTSKPVPDFVDGAGIFPLVNRVMIGLLVVGGAICLWRWRSPAHAFLVIGIVIIATGPAVETDFPYRRSIGMVPLLCAVAAQPLALVWDWARRRGTLAAAIASVIVALTVGGVGAIDFSRYFTTYDDSPIARLVFGYDMAAASRYIAQQPDTTYVCFAFDRAPFNQEIRRFIAPNAQGESRSQEFGGQLSLQSDRSRDILYVLMGKYLGAAAAVEKLYPGGSRYRGRDADGNLLFDAYFLPALSSSRTSTDAAVVLQYSAGTSSLPCGAAAAADVNGDGAIDAVDAALILQYDAGLIHAF
jgi:hypothetical protein